MDSLVVVPCAIAAICLVAAVWFWGRWKGAERAVAGLEATRRMDRADIREANARAVEVARSREDYERALGLPFYSEEQTLQALRARAFQGDELATDILQARLSRQLEEAIPELAGPPAVR